MNFLIDSNSTVDDVIETQSRSMSDPSLSDIVLNNKMAFVWTLKIIKSCGQRPKSDWRFKEKGPEFTLYDDEKEFSIAMR